MKKYRFINDNAHAWLEVPIEEARQVPDISLYSYVSEDGTIAYLEEDCDAPKFLHSIGELVDGKRVYRVELEEVYDEPYCFIRRLRRYV